MVVVIDPAARTATVHRAGPSADVRGEAGTLDLDPIVAGFSIPVRLVFE